MRCYCCDSDVSVGRKAKLRPWLEFSTDDGGPDSPAYAHYLKQVTYRWAVVCPPCYRILDTFDGMGEIGGKLWGINGASRGDKAPVLNETAYLAWQRREAEKMGLDADD